MHLFRTDTAPDFCDAHANRKSIAQREWGYTTKLLLCPINQAKITKYMIENEKNMNIFPHACLMHPLKTCENTSRL